MAFRVQGKCCKRIPPGERRLKGIGVVWFLSAPPWPVSHTTWCPSLKASGAKPYGDS